MAAGQKEPFTREQIALIKATLSADGSWRDLAMLSLGLDTMLRASDLVKLKTHTLLDWQGNVKGEFSIQQKKTSMPVAVALTDSTVKNVSTWLKRRDEGSIYVFPGRNGAGHISVDRYRAAVKIWARIARVDPANYSTHSIRRTKPTIAYRETGNVELVRQMLGHTDTAATSAYLGVKKAEVLSISRKIEI